MWELQYDQFYYTANARALARDGTGLLHFNAYDERPDAPRIYSHLYTTLLAGAARLFHIEPFYASFILRPLFGVLLALALWYFLGPFFPDVRWRSAAFACLLTSGGMAGLAAVCQALVSSQPGSGIDGLFRSFAEHFYADEGAARDWLCSIARNYLIVPEMLYHAIWFAAAGAYLNGRRGLSMVLVAAELYAHPFTGPELGGVLIAVCAMDMIVEKKFNPYPVVVFFLLLLFLADAHWMDRDAGQRMLRARWQQFKLVIPLRCYPMIYGMWIPLALAACFSLRKTFYTDPALRFAILQAGVVFSMSNHHLFLNREFQPAHFSRGYFFAALVVLSFKYLSVRISKFFSKPRLLALMFLVLSADSALYFMYVTVRAADPPQVITADQWDAIQKLKDVSPRQFVASDADIGYLLPVFSPHRVLQGHFAITPNFDEKSRLWDSWIVSGDGTLFKKYPDISVIVVPRAAAGPGRAKSGLSGLWKPLFENESFFVIQKIQ